MKRIVLCFDGTWNKPADMSLPADLRVETNVSRFFQSVATAGDDGVVQMPWYNKGVGTEWFDRIAGGAFGLGIDEHIRAGYRFLAETYEDGDEVYVLGFSRGAYAARSLVGLVRNCGLVRPRFVAEETLVAYVIYRMRDSGPDSSTARAFRAMFSREIKIRFLGVWDTVGALGIPGHLADRLNMALYQFHDTELSGIVENAYQAIALDENREDYNVTLWDPKEKPAQTVEQRWFSGAHADVGGGYSERLLSDITLFWMQEKAAALGLGLTRVTPGERNYLGPSNDSYTQFLGGEYARKFPRFFRRVLATRFGNEVIDPTIDLRRREFAPPYRPQNVGLPPLAP